MDQQGSREFNTLTTVEVFKLMQREIEKAQEIVKLPKHQLRLHLGKSKWDLDVFLEKFYDGSLKIPENIQAETVTAKSQEKVPRRSKRNLPKSFDTSAEPTKKVSRQSKRSKTCEICFEDFDEKFMVSEGNCNHSFCKSCTKKHLETSISSSSFLDSIECPGFRCGQTLGDEFVFSHLEDSFTTKYQRLISNDFVANSRCIKWCPAPACLLAVKTEQRDLTTAIKCKCGHRFCFKCSEPIHDLINCQLVKNYKKFMEANLETANWIIKNSKQCPQCTIDIEKVSGCNHMTCFKCRYQFCWICFSQWDKHTVCTPTESKAIKTGDMRKFSEAHTKHLSMVQSIKFDEQMYKAKLKSNHLQKRDEWIKIDFLAEAVAILLRCRRTLADSYIFAFFYFNEDDTQFLLFQLNQTKLQQSTEDLSHMLETQVNAENYHEMRQQITYATKYCKLSHKALFEHVEDGFANDIWKQIF